MGYAKYKEDIGKLKKLQTDIASWSELTAVERNAFRTNLNAYAVRIEELRSRSEKILEILTNPEVDVVEERDKWMESYQAQRQITVDVTENLKAAREQNAVLRAEKNCLVKKIKVIEEQVGTESQKLSQAEAKVKDRDQNIKRLEILLSNSSRNDFSRMLDQ